MTFNQSNNTYQYSPNYDFQGYQTYQPEIPNVNFNNQDDLTTPMFDASAINLSENKHINKIVPSSIPCEVLKLNNVSEVPHSNLNDNMVNMFRLNSSIDVPIKKQDVHMDLYTQMAAYYMLWVRTNISFFVQLVEAGHKAEDIIPYINLIIGDYYTLSSTGKRSKNSNLINITYAR